jgi:hypothetical protein
MSRRETRPNRGNNRASKSLKAHNILMHRIMTSNFSTLSIVPRIFASRSPIEVYRLTFSFHRHLLRPGTRRTLSISRSSYARISLRVFDLWSSLSLFLFHRHPKAFARIDRRGCEHICCSEQGYISECAVIYLQHIGWKSSLYI